MATMDRLPPFDGDGFSRTTRGAGLGRCPALLLALAGALLPAAGCHLPEWVHNGFKVGPNYHKPSAPVAPEWIDYKDPRVKSEEQDLSEWWNVFNDPALSALEEDAYRQNLSLREAGARILEAQANRGIAVGNLFAQLQQAIGSYSRNQISEQIANPFPQSRFDNWAAGFTASWELDIWGLFRRAIESANAVLDASVDNYDDVLVILLADVATSYVQYRTFQERLSYTRTNVALQERALQIAEDRFKAGASTERDVQQARQILEQTRALIPLLESLLRQTGNSLCVLLGIPPTDLARVLGQDGVIPATPAEVAVGIPADLLRRRPDVRRAERLAAAQSAQIGVAAANFYPHFTLAGTIGVAAEDFSDLFHLNAPSSFIGTVGPSFQWNILNYGRILNTVRGEDAKFQARVYAYQNTVLKAGREAEDAIIGFLKSQQRAVFLDKSVKAAQRNEEITMLQYKEGAIDFTPVLLVEQVLAQQQDELAQVRGDIALNLIAIYRSLGGGWEMRLARDGNGRNGNGCGPARPGAHAEAVRPVRGPVRTNGQAVGRPERQPVARLEDPQPVHQ
jgi:NodT family efflux transporter outer membrane factor (OMF) lipoprotein